MFINYIQSFQFIIDYKSTIQYNNNECGGKITIDDNTVYPPCHSIEVASNRSREISKLDKNYDDSVLYFYIVRNEEPISDLFSFGTLDYYRDIRVTVVNKQLESYAQDGQLEAQVFHFNFTYALSSIAGDKKSYKTFININQKDLELNFPNTYTINGPLEFYGWDKNADLGVSPVIATREYIGNLVVNDVGFYTSYPFSNTYINPNDFKANNCIFNDTWSVPAYYKTSEFNNCQFNNFKNSDRLLEVVSESVKFNGCQFFNNSFEPIEGIIAHITLGSVVIGEVRNSIFKDNHVKTLYSGGMDFYPSLLYNIVFSNVSFINNSLVDGEDRINYLFEFIKPEGGSIVTFKDINITAAQGYEDQLVNSGLLYYYSNIYDTTIYSNFENVNSNYNFKDLFNISNNTILSIKNSLIKNWNNTDSSSMDNTSGSSNSSSSSSSDNNNSNSNSNSNNNKNLVLKIVLPIVLFIVVLAVTLIIIFIIKRRKNQIKIKNDQIELNSNIDNITIKSAPSSSISSEKSAQVEYNHNNKK